MVWATPMHSREEVNRAGRLIAERDDGFEWLFNPEYPPALAVVNNWRASHSYCVNTFQATLRLRAKKISPGMVFAQRVKRLESIESKLRRQPKMKLTQMQDIGGCRAIMPECSMARELAQFYHEHALAHELASSKDYIEEPKAEGYRGIHLIYRYRGGSRITAYEDLKVEIQIRSALQHAWATAVETVGIFTRQALKSSEGDGQWLRFFALASSVIAETEKCAPVPGLPGPRERDEELAELGRRLKVREALSTYQATLQALERHGSKDAKFFVLTLVPAENRIIADGYLTRDSMQANAKYAEEEARLQGSAGAQTVMVKVDSASALRKAYPNYFADTTRFLNALSHKQI